MVEKLVTIATFADPIEANLAKIKLASEDIDCFLLDENAVATYWLISSVLGGIKLQVRQSDVTKATEILSRKPAQTEEPEEKEQDDEPAIPPCPKCGSEDVEYERFSKKWAFLSILLFRFPLPFLKETYKCKTCGFTWKQQ